MSEPGGQGAGLATPTRGALAGRGRHLWEARVGPGSAGPRRTLAGTRPPRGPCGALCGVRRGAERPGAPRGPAGRGAARQGAAVGSHAPGGGQSRKWLQPQGSSSVLELIALGRTPKPARRRKRAFPRRGHRLRAGSGPQLWTPGWLLGRRVPAARPAPRRPRTPPAAHPDLCRVNTPPPPRRPLRESPGPPRGHGVCLPARGQVLAKRAGPARCRLQCHLEGEIPLQQFTF